QAMLFFLGLATLLAYAVARYYARVRKYPPGPFPWPFIGNIYQQNYSRKHLNSECFAPDFDGIYTLYNPHPNIYLTDYEGLREAFVERGEDYSGRPINIFLQEMFMYAPNGGVINSNGENWREQRRTALSILRDFGMGKNLMEQQMHANIEEYLENLEKIGDKSKVDLRWPIQLMVGNIITEALFGFRFKNEDREQLMKYVRDFAQMFVDLAKCPEVALCFATPSLLKIPFIGNYCLYRHRDKFRKVSKNYI
ncbi:hypothetical protein PFISCL1PPCAC_14274, partial [Pristionchus fissidentatus]